MGCRRRRSAKRDAMLMRGEQAMKLRVQGISCRQIAEAMRGKNGISLTYSSATAQRDLDAIRKEVLSECRDVMERACADSTARMNMLLQILYGQLRECTTPLERIQVIDRILKIDAEVRKLHGLDRPVKIAQTDTNGNNPPIEQPTVLFTSMTEEDLKKLKEQTSV